MLKRYSTKQLLPEPTTLAARRALEKSSHFRGRTSTLQFEFDRGVLTINGILPSFYLKQVMNSILRDVSNVQRVVDRVDVVCCDGLSGLRNPR